MRCSRRPGSQHQGARVQRQGRGPAVPGPAQHTPGRRRPRQLRAARAACRAVPIRGHLRASARRGPDGPPGCPRAHRRRPGLLVDAGRVLRTGAAAVRVRRRRGRPPAIHDGRRPGGEHAAPVGLPRRDRRRLAGGHSDAAHLRRPRRSCHRQGHRRGHAGPVGRAGDRRGHGERVPAPAAVGCPRPRPPRARRPACRGRPPREHRRTAGDCRRPAQPPGTRTALRRGSPATGRNRAQGGSGAGQPPVHDDRRAEQVRPAGG